MELPTCPACGQSVLDEDVEHCPFCGASMTGKPMPPKAQPAAPQAASRAAPAESKGRPQASHSTSAVKGETKGQPVKEVDPFAVDTPAVKAAIPAARKPRKGRTYKVVCPMCETVSYVPRKAAGRDVHCPNRECLVPVFKAPAIEKKQPAQPEPKSRTTPMVLVAAGSMLLIAAVLAGFWFFMLRNDETVRRPLQSRPVAETDPRDGTDDSSAEGQTVEPSQPVAPKGPTLAEIRDSIPELMIEISREEDDNRSKPYCRRSTAEVFVAIGDLQGARAQLEQLQVVGREVPFYRVMPLAMIAWKQLQQGDETSAIQTLDDAYKAAQSLPRVGRLPLDSATSLAAVLVAAGRFDQARDLIAQHQGSGTLGRLSADLYRVREFETYDLDAAGPHDRLIRWTAPQWVAVTLGLAAHRRWDAALRWATAHPTQEGRTECVIAWGESLVEQAYSTDRPEALQQVEKAANALQTAGRVRLFARIAALQSAAGESAAAAATLDKARNLMASVQIPSPVALPDMEKLYRSFSLPEPTPLRLSALAAAELARAESILGDAEAAWEHMSAAFDLCRAMAPAVGVIQQKLDEIDRRGSRAVRNQLKASLELDTDDEARRAFRNYFKLCKEIREAAETRLQLQVALLGEAARSNLRDRIWDLVRASAEHNEPAQREPYYNTRLPWLLADAYRNAGNDERASEIRSILSKNNVAPDPWVELKQTAEQHVAESRVAQAASVVDRSRVDRYLRSHLALGLACRLMSRGEADAAYDFVTSLDDQIMREDAFELISALAVKNGRGQAVWNVIKNVELPPTERIALCRGFIAGYQSFAPAKSHDQPASEAAEDAHSN